MTDTKELFLKLIGDEEQEAVAPIFMQQILNRGIECIPDVIQTGAKKGQTLKAHTQNVVCFSYHLSEILNIADNDRIQLIAAAYVHDLNKFPEYEGKSYGSIANSENVQKIIKIMLSEGGHEFDLDIERIVSLIRAHSGHYHADGDSLFAEQHRNDSRDRLMGILQAADTLDLSHHFHEREQKEKALRKINGLIQDFQYEFTWHYFSDNRGIYTNLIQNTLVNIYRNQNAVPLLLYPEGVWYLIKKGKQATVSAPDAAKQLQRQIDLMSLQDPSKSLSSAKVGFKFAQNPFELGLQADQVMALIVEQIMNRKEKWYADKYEKLASESGKKCFKEYGKWLAKSSERAKKFDNSRKKFEKLLEQSKLKPDFNEDDEAFWNLPAKKQEQIKKVRADYLKIGQEADLENSFKSAPLWNEEPKRLFYNDPDVLRLGDLTGSFAILLSNHIGFDSEKAWDIAAEQAGLSYEGYAELNFFDTQSDRGYRTAAILHEKGTAFQEVQKLYTDFLDSLTGQNQKETPADQDISDYIAANLRTQDGDFKINTGILKQYAESNHKQCSHCGAGFGLELMKGTLPDGIKPQLFSNRLKGGGGEPKRNVCKVCQQGFLVEKLVSEVYENHFYLHLFSDGGEHSSHAEPSVFLESLKNGIMALQSTDCRTFLMQPGQVIKEYLNEKIPRLYGDAKKTWGMLVPKFSQSIGGQITIGINPPGGKESNDSIRFLFSLFHLLVITKRFNLRGMMSRSSIPPLKAGEFDKLYIDHVPLSFRALIPENNLDSKSAGQLWEKLTCLYGLRNTYNLVDEKEIVTIAKTLYDTSGLDLMYHLKKSYASSKFTKDKDIKPWKQAWPYLEPFIREEELMPIKTMAEIALKYHFHGQSWKETSQAKPIDLAFDALSKHREPESEDELKMVILHDVTRGLERLSLSDSLGKERYDAVREFVNIFFEQVFKGRYRGDKNRMIKEQRRIRAAFLGFLTVLRIDNKNNEQGKEKDND